MEILLTRHGQTEWNVLQKAQGKSDIILNEVGKQQAEETANQLKNVKIDLIICSPLKRAKETAYIINKSKNVPIIFDERISERDFGEFEGWQTTKFDFKGFWSYKRNQKYDRAENIKNLFTRVYDFLDEIKIKYAGKKILVVAHGGVSIPVKCYFEGIPDMDTLWPLCIDNCEVTKFSYKEE